MRCLSADGVRRNMSVPWAIEVEPANINVNVTESLQFPINLEINKSFLR